MVSKRSPLTGKQLSIILTKARATEGQKRSIRSAFRLSTVTDASSFRDVIRLSRVSRRSSVISPRLMRAFRDVAGVKRVKTVAAKTVRKNPKDAMVLTPFPVRRYFA